MADNEQTDEGVVKFDFGAYPENTCFHERRSGKDRREEAAGKEGVESERRQVKDRRRKRVDPTTFDKQYSEAEMEFMNAMQAYKVRTGKSFPTYEEVLEVARGLGYERVEEPTEIEALMPEYGEN